MTHRTDDDSDPKLKLQPITQVLARQGQGTDPFDDRGPMPAADWETVTAELRTGSATFWLAAIGSGGAPHVRPLFAAWTGTSFVLASKHRTVKSRALRVDGRCTITADLGFVHLVVEGAAQWVTGPVGLERASRAMLEVFEWPTTINGDQLDAEYAAPTSGGPPFDVYELHPHTAFGFPTNDDFEPTRWTFPEQLAEEGEPQA